ncbi:plastocyanin/azurin family copper-binding protein [Candidatus Nitrosopelagicus sp.]|nr:plastocyanin/azurin family copper-binding protein [Candidatus Nitrosopelagicus sp.]
MTSADKFGVIFTIAFVAAMIVIMGGLLQVDNTSTPSVTAPAQTYSPPPTPAAPQPSVAQQAAPQTSSSDNLKYTIRGGIVDSIDKDENHNAVKIIMDSRLDGQLTITLTSDSVIPFDDGTYFVTVDGEEVEFTQVGKRLTIDFMANSQKIMIYGEGYKSGGHSMGHSEDSKEHEAMMAADKAAADKAATDKAAADKAAADKAAADKAAADKAAADKAAADKAAADKAAADKAAAAAAAAKAPMAVTIEPVEGSGAPGCEPECYSPSTATISAGGTVTFSNTDTAPHTSTSGTAANGPDGVFDTSLIMANASFDVTLSDAGTYPYFCMVHPWMEGTVIVE